MPDCIAISGRAQRGRIAHRPLARHGRERAPRPGLRPRLASSMVAAAFAVGVAEQVSKRLGALCERSSATRRSDAVPVVTTSPPRGLRPCTPVWKRHMWRRLGRERGAGAEPRGGGLFAGAPTYDRCGLPTFAAGMAADDVRFGIDPWLGVRSRPCRANTVGARYGLSVIAP